MHNIVSCTSRTFIMVNINVQVAKKIALLFWSKAGKFLIQNADKISNVTTWMAISK